LRMAHPLQMRIETRVWGLVARSGFEMPFGNILQQVEDR
jgi:hypothetical protein